MCGLVGILTLDSFGFNQADVSRFNQLLVCDSVRGPDSTGVFGVDKLGNASYLKQAGNPFKLIESDEYKQFTTEMYQSMRFVVGHNRKATIGTISDETAHPFQEGNIVLVHNGTLTNHKDLTDNEVEVDSHAITHAIVEKGYKEALKELQGAFTLIWYDASDKALRFVRNGQRPLSMIKHGSKVYLSSEAALAEWLISREYTTLSTTTTHVKPGVVYTLKVDGREIEEEPVQLYEPPKLVQQQVTYLPRQQRKANQEKKQQDTGSGTPFYKGWDGLECRVGDHIAVHVHEVLPTHVVMAGSSSSYLKGTRIFPDQPPVLIYATQDEVDSYTESGSPMVWCKVTRVAYENGFPMRIYAEKPDEYVPEYDVTGNEVFLEEWKAVTDHKCKACGEPVYWKDINQSRFKFKSSMKHRIVCKTCVERSKK